MDEYIALRIDYDVMEGDAVVHPEYYALDPLNQLDLLSDWMGELASLYKIARIAFNEEFDEIRRKASEKNN